MPDALPQAKTKTPAQAQQESPRKRSGVVRPMQSDVTALSPETKTVLGRTFVHEGRALPRSTSDRWRARLLWTCLSALTLLIASTGAAYVFPKTFVPAAPWLARLPWFPTPPPPPVFSAPLPLLPTEGDELLTLNPQNPADFFDHLARIVRAPNERQGIIKRVVVAYEQASATPEQASAQRALTLADFLALYHLTPPPRFLEHADTPFMLFVYYGREGGRIGWIAQLTDQDQVASDMRLWERSLAQDFQPLLFDDFNNAAAATTSAFADRAFRNIDWRYFDRAPAEDQGIGYAIFPARHYLLFTTSANAMETIIRRLFDTL